jgi:GNAT superfamily N-acetyltransferase
MANALNRHEALSPRAFTAAIVRRDAFGRRRAFNTDVAARELWMHDLFVQPTWRGRGVGRALVTAVAREAARRGFACLEWGVRAANARIASLRGRALASVAAGR